jgi:hypothetical protein
MLSPAVLFSFKEIKHIPSFGILSFIEEQMFKPIMEQLQMASNTTFPEGEHMRQFIGLVRLSGPLPGF